MAPPPSPPTCTPPACTPRTSVPPLTRPVRAWWRAGAYAVAGLSVLLIYLGARLTLAGVADFQTRAFLTDWESRRTPPSAQAWSVAYASAARATTVFPVPQGRYLERLGYVHAWQHHHAPLGAAHAGASRHAARDAYRAATRARPTWPYAWLALAEVKLRLLEFDPEFHHALAQVHALAPWRPSINHRLALLGLTAWPQLAAAQRSASLESARRALAHLNAISATALFTQASVAGQGPTLCNSLEDATRKRMHRHCR